MCVEDCSPACISLMPNEVLELIASQLVLTFKDVISLSLTSKRTHEATSFLISPPLEIENLDETDRVYPRSGLSRAAVINVPFTLSESQSQSNQLQKLLARTPRLRYLAISRPPLDPSEPPSRWEPSRSKTSTHPFPLRSSHFQSPSSPYLDDLTHLELCDLSVHPMLLSRLARLTHLKLSVSGHQDAYRPCEVLSIISFAKQCRLVAFEVGLHAVVEQRDRTNVVRACVDAWPELRTLNLFSVGSEAKVPGLSDQWARPESAADSAKELAAILQQCPRITMLSLPLAVPDVPSSTTLADIFRDACPALKSFRCLIPTASKSSTRPFVESYEVVKCKRTEADGWTCAKEESRSNAGRIFGMINEM